MDMLEKIKEVKKLEPKSIIFVKIGSFYNVYGDDSFILSYLFGYKTKLLENGCRTCGFQITSASKVFSKLKENIINYLIIDKRLDFEIIEKNDFKRKNQYKNFLKIALPYMNLKEKLETLCQNILENMDNQDFESELENLENIKEILYKRNLVRS